MMRREGFVFYASFAEAIECLPEDSQLEAYRAIVNYAINGELPEIGIAAAIVKLVKPQIDANNKRYENGMKGGRKTKVEPNENQNETKTEPKPNQKETKTEPNATYHEPKDKDKDKDKDKEKDKEKESAYADKKEKAVITLTLESGEEYPVTAEDIGEYRKLYPAVDVMQELRKMRGWCNDNPQKRKTARGIRKFIGGWLAREQDRGAPQKASRGQERVVVTPYADIAQQVIMRRLANGN